ncbi:hypothetical protein MMC07_008972 [Pseudocyphellaria aurata]|nr:hypothetical protein [Pseudocyphellaria aurata]
MKYLTALLALAFVSVAVAGPGTVKQDPLLFTTGNSDYKLASAARPSGPEVETGDDFVINKAVQITGAKFQGARPSLLLYAHLRRSQLHCAGHGYVWQLSVAMHHQTPLFINASRGYRSDQQRLDQRCASQSGCSDYCQKDQVKRLRGFNRQLSTALLGLVLYINGAAHWHVDNINNSEIAICKVNVEFYLVFPLLSEETDPERLTSKNPPFPTAKVAARQNSPSDKVLFERVDVTFEVKVLKSSATVPLSLRNAQIKPKPNQKQKLSPWTGTAIELSVKFPSVPFKANAHWFFVPQVDASPGNEFLWLSAPKPIAAVSPCPPAYCPRPAEAALVAICRQHLV